MDISKIENFANNAIGRLVGLSYFSMLRIFGRELKKVSLDITVEQCRLLFALFIQDNRTQQEIADFLIQEKSSTSRLIDSLEQKGYVQRRPDKQDERQKRIVLTPKAREVEPICLQCAQKAQTAIKEQFSEEEWQNLMQLTQKLAEITRAL